MSNGSSRPGGLTALAVLNFIFAGLSALGVLGLAMALGLAKTDSKLADELAKVPPGMLMFGIGVSLVATILLIVSGIGYLGQKRFLGRILGSAYGVVAIGSGVTNLVLMGQGFGIMNIVGFIYPALTLLLLNSIFKDDFVNP